MAVINTKRAPNGFIHNIYHDIERNCHIVKNHMSVSLATVYSDTRSGSSSPLWNAFTGNLRHIWTKVTEVRMYSIEYSAKL